jgi:hypothetical protein
MIHQPVHEHKIVQMPLHIRDEPRIQKGLINAEFHLLIDVDDDDDDMQDLMENYIISYDIPMVKIVKWREGGNGSRICK